MGRDKAIVKLIYGLILLIIIYVLIMHVDASTTTDAITSTIDFGNEKLTVDFINKTYEISENSLTTGTSSALNLKDAFRIYIHGQEYYLIFWNISEDKSGIMTSNKKFGYLKKNQSKVVDLNDDKIYDIILTLNELNSTTANISIKEYKTENNSSGSGYKELFDIVMDIKEEKITSSIDLTISTDFVNFGDGPSKINIVYTITDSFGKEIYRGLDEKVVYTEESLIKNFDFLKLAPGKYKIKTEIFYGKNQTAESEKDFEVITKNSSDNLMIILACFSFIVIVIVFFYYAKKFHASRAK